MKAILIKTNFATGDRAGNLVLRKNRNIPGDTSWQNYEAGIEMRLVVDENTESMEGIDGITILDGPDEIDRAIKENFTKEASDSYQITSPELFAASIISKQINMEDLSSDGDDESMLKVLYERGALGITKIGPSPPCTCAEMVDRWLKGPG